VASLAERLAGRTLELVDIPSQSGSEDAVRAYVRGLVPPSFEVEFAGEDASLHVRGRRPGTPLVLLVGHYDTVPAQGNVPGHITNGAVHGCGASDMKGGLAVALELAGDLAAEPPARYDIGLLLFGKEELPPEQSPLPELFARSTLVHEAELAVLLEPTDLTIQAGCLGHMSARLIFHGVSGHSARPWAAENAIEKALAGLAPIAALEPRPVEVGGLTFTEVLTITQLESGIAVNVVPDRAVATLSFRYAPGRTPSEAEAYLRSLVPEGAELEVTGDSPPARVVTDAPLVRALQQAGELPLEPKQAWTNVADFTVRGIDAVNFGPGATRFAHRRDEQVEIRALVGAYETLRRFLAG
jgi:succinyl-diaminopimelate desuccinylase